MCFQYFELCCYYETTHKQIWISNWNTSEWIFVVVVWIIFFFLNILFFFSLPSRALTSAYTSYSLIYTLLSLFFFYRQMYVKSQIFIIIIFVYYFCFVFVLFWNRLISNKEFIANFKNQSLSFLLYALLCLLLLNSFDLKERKEMKKVKIKEEK